jgi:hypothetical protein
MRLPHTRRSSIASPNSPALRPRVCIAVLKLVSHGRIGDAVTEIAEAVFFIADKLMAGYKSPQGVTARYSVPLPHPEMRL